MSNKIEKSLTETEVREITTQWEKDGYEFKGNGFLDRDDPPECRCCGETGFFYALWEHPTLEERYGDNDGEMHRFPATKCFNRCYECGYEWVGGDE